MRVLALLTFLGALGACDAPRTERPPAAPVVQEALPAPALSKQQLEERSAQCARTAREDARRAWMQGDAEVGSHYNVKLQACFYVLTVVQPDAFRKQLYDADTQELYGEFIGTAAVQTTCRMEALHCASAGEWDVLAAAYMTE